MNRQPYIAIVGEKDKGLLEIKDHLHRSQLVVKYIPTITKVVEELCKSLPELIVHNLKTIPDTVLFDKLHSINPNPQIPVIVLYTQSRDLKPTFITNYSGHLEYICLPVPFDYLIKKINACTHNPNSIYPLPYLSQKESTEKESIKEKLSQSQNLTLLGELASGIAHDFNGVFCGILGYAEMAKLKFGRNNPSLEKYTDSIISFSKRAGNLTKKILSFARGSKQTNQNLNIHNLLVEVIDMLYHTINKRYQLRRSFHATKINVVGDPALIQNAIINLSLNARDAMPGGGAITFTTENVWLKDKDLSNAGLNIPPGQYFLLSVADTGIGIKNEISNKIFEPFFTTKDEGKGTGLGLPSVLSTLKAHGGGVTVDSQPGEGTTFNLYFPCGTLKDDEDVEISTRKIPKVGGHIMLVDDEDGFRELIREMLTDFGYQITLAEDGHEALEYFREQHTAINLVIIDMNLPRLSGLECFREMKKIDSNIKAILCTGINISEEDMAEEGILDFIQKPFEMKNLLKAIANVLNPETRWLRKNR